MTFMTLNQSAARSGSSLNSPDRRRPRSAARWATLAALVLGAGLAMGQDAQPLAAAADAAQEAVQLAVQQAAPEAGQSARFVVDNLWLLIATAMVFVMHLGFACLETGLTRAKNTVNILFKNTAIVAIGLITYMLIGFNLMYPGDGWTVEGVIGALRLGVSPPVDGSGMLPAYAGGYTYWTDFIFQAMFAATAATIVSGAVAERVRLGPFLVFSTVYVAVVYPVLGSWKWGGGWLDGLGFYDFAGSALVHTVGGWGALAGVLVLGPRLGKYLLGEGGRRQIRPLVGHSMPLAAIGVFLLWFGWYGFNGGSVLSADPGDPGPDAANPYGFGGVSLVFVTTSMAAAAGIISAIAASWIIQKKPDLSMALNGCLAGLVAVTAGADAYRVESAVVIGLVAGPLAVLAVLALDRLRLDDPVGAISVHLVCGVWGTLAVGLFADRGRMNAIDDAGVGVGTLGDQALGLLATGAVAFPAALAIFTALRLTVGLRVGRDEELGGLDIGEHGMEAYGGFQVFADH